MKDIIFGFLIGIGKIIPGVSGSVIAISLGVYEKMVEAVSNIFNKKNMFFLLKIGLGLIISISLFSKLIVFIINNYYINTMFIFSGVILGSVIMIDKKINKKKYYLYTLITILLLIILNLLAANVNLPKNQVTFFISGLIDAFAMVIPGISGTALLIMIGTYNHVLDLFSQLLNLSYIINNFKLIISFGIGIFIGIITISKIMNFMFQKKTELTYSIILGLIIFSVITMIWPLLFYGFQTLKGLFLFFLSFYFCKKLS